MALAPGTRLGVYEITAQIGEGGMGQVYRATDTKLKRQIAIKILPPSLAADHDRLARFQREAEVLASLNHPNIAAIYGLEENGGITALVMELVEGDELSQRISRGAIPLDEALPIAKQIAEALEAAHEHGVIHRDLKPANIKVRDDGTVKVLDFGLAKAMDLGAGGAGSAGKAGLSMSPTITSPALMTAAGMILGTAAYMSPEQARGKTVDQRADIWAFGAVLYEILTSCRAFPGEDITDTIVSVVSKEPDWAALPAATPAGLRRLLARCLKKDPKLRLQAIGEARIVLGDPSALLAQTASDASTGPLGSDGTDVVSGFSPISRARSRSLWRRSMPAALSAIVAGVVVGAAMWSRGLTPAAPLAVTRFPLVLPEGQTLTSSRQTVAISPDGTRLVWLVDNQLYLRSMSEVTAKVIDGLGRSPNSPVFSPDGQSIAFWSDNAIRRIAVTGGTAITICPADIPFGMSWGPAGIVFGQGAKGILRVSPNGGTPETLVKVDQVAGEVAHSPEVLPDGQHVLFTLATGTALDRWDRARIVVQSLTSGEQKVVVTGGSDARYSPTGHLLHAVSGTLFALAFNLGSRETSGSPVPVIEGIRRSTFTGMADFSVSRAGSLVYVPGPSSGFGGMDIGVADRRGTVEPLKLPPGSYVTPRVSPDGKRIAFETTDGKEAAIWIYDLSGATAMRRLTFGSNNHSPIWSSDGTRVAFQSDREGDPAIFWQAADGTGTAERLTKPAQGESHVPDSWSPNGDTLLFDVVKGTDTSLWMLSLKEKKTTLFGEVHSDSVPPGAVFSPDGRWVAYVSTERGLARTYVQPFPATGAKYELPARRDLPNHPAWSPDGKELFYNPRSGAFEAVSIVTQPTFAFGNPVAIPRRFPSAGPGTRRPYDVTPSGKFVSAIATGDAQNAAAQGQIQVVLTWFEELKARVPVK